MLRQQQLLEAYAVPTVETYMENNPTTENIVNKNLDLTTSNVIPSTTIIESTSTKKVDITRKISNDEDVEEFKDMAIITQNSTDYQYYDYDSNEMTDEDYL